MSSSKNNEIKILKEVTDRTIKEVMKYDVVLPALYKDIFAEKIRGFDIELVDELDLATEMAATKLNSFEEKVTQNAGKLQEEVTRATHAIEAKDAAALARIREDIGRLQNEISEIRSELYFDELTRIRNRKWLFDQYAGGGSLPCEGVMVFCDLDHFKEINDTHGHIVGDKVLAVFGQALHHSGDGIAVRYAGDEFIVICERMDTARAVTHIETISAHLQKKLFKVGEEKSFKLTFSYGIESFAVGAPLIEVLEGADKKMYASKHTR